VQVDSTVKRRCRQVKIRARVRSRGTQQRLFPGPRRPVFRNRRIRVESEQRGDTTPYAGLAAPVLLAKKLGLDRAIDARLGLLKFPLPYTESDHVLTHAYNLFVGGSCIQDIQNLQASEAVLKLLGADRIPDPTTAGDFLPDRSERAAIGRRRGAREGLEEDAASLSSARDGGHRQSHQGSVRRVQAGGGFFLHSKVVVSPAARHPGRDGREPSPDQPARQRAQRGGCGQDAAGRLRPDVQRIRRGVSARRQQVLSARDRDLVREAGLCRAFRRGEGSLAERPENRGNIGRNGVDALHRATGQAAASAQRQAAEKASASSPADRGATGVSQPPYDQGVGDRGSVFPDKMRRDLSAHHQATTHRGAKRPVDNSSGVTSTVSS